jgi:hypothetical protein
MNVSLELLFISFSNAASNMFSCLRSIFAFMESFYLTSSHFLLKEMQLLPGRYRDRGGHVGDRWAPHWTALYLALLYLE